jgi:catechol 2,3-dioxygenase-like lactoylglutathione lyase family enzyme
MLGESIIQAIICTAQPDKARAFYSDTLGLKLIEENQYGLVFFGKVGILRVAKVPSMIPAATSVAGFIVDDAIATTNALAAKGVKLERYPFLQHDELGLWSAPDGTKVGWFRDPDFNVISITQMAK